MSESRYLSAADTAKLIRKVIKREFADIKFGVTTKTYSMGASVSIQWIDGPTTKQVDAVTGDYQGKGFDGMIDLSYYYDAWLCPDGSVSIAKCRHLDIDNPAPNADAELVHFGASSVHTSRHHSPEFVRHVAAEMEAKTGWKAPTILEQDSYWSRSKTVPTAYFERGYTPDDDTTEREFTQALYLTPGDGPLVTNFDYAFKDEDKDDDPEPWAKDEERDRGRAFESEQNKAIHEATVREIAENRERNDRAQAEAVPEIASEPIGPSRSLLPQEPKPPVVESAPEPEQAEASDNVGDIRDLLLHELRALATEIIHETDSEFVQRCVMRKISVVNGSTNLRALLQVGDDLMLIAEGI